LASPELVARKAVKAIYRNQGVVTVTWLARFLWFAKRLAPRLWEFATRARRSKKQAVATTSEPER
jgi:hypothetical protein